MFGFGFRLSTIVNCVLKQSRDLTCVTPAEYLLALLKFAGLAVLSELLVARLAVLSELLAVRLAGFSEMLAARSGLSELAGICCLHMKLRNCW